MDNDNKFYLTYGDTPVAFDLGFIPEKMEKLLKEYGGEILPVFREVLAEELTKQLPDVVHELVARMLKQRPTSRIKLKSALGHILELNDNAVKQEYGKTQARITTELKEEKRFFARVLDIIFPELVGVNYVTVGGSLPRDFWAAYRTKDQIIQLVRDYGERFWVWKCEKVKNRPGEYILHYKIQGGLEEIEKEYGKD